MQGGYLLWGQCGPEVRVSLKDKPIPAVPLDTHRDARLVTHRHNIVLRVLQQKLSPSWVGGRLEEGGGGTMMYGNISRMQSFYDV